MGCAFYMLTGICVFCIAGIIFLSTPAGEKWMKKMNE